MTQSSTNRKPAISLFLPSFGNGGVERMMVHLASGFASQQIPTDFVIRNSDVPYIRSLPPEVRLVELNSLNSKDPLTAACRYLAEAKPLTLLTSKDENNELAVHAKVKSGVETRIVLRAPVNISSRLKYKRCGPVKKWITYHRLRKMYLQADSCVAVSEGVADDLARISGLPKAFFHVIRNPVLTPDLEVKASSPLDHPWFKDKRCPVMIGIGRLGSQKNFEFLIEAHGIIRRKRKCRLIILGEGRRRARLERLVRTRGLDDSVELAGFVENPYVYLKRSDLFALTSLWEGSPNALVEALGLGIPAVATDCESGPREILLNGLIGKLVPLGDLQGFAEASLQTLLDPPKPETLRKAVAEYTIEIATRRYLEILLGSGYQDLREGI